MSRPLWTKKYDHDHPPKNHLLHPLYNENIPDDFNSDTLDLLPPKNTVPNDAWKARMHFMTGPTRHASYPACWDVKGHLRNLSLPFGRPAITNGNYVIGYGNVQLHDDEDEEAGLSRMVPNRVAKSRRPENYLGDDVGSKTSAPKSETKKNAGRKPAAKSATKPKATSVKRFTRGKAEEEVQQLEAKTFKTIIVYRYTIPGKARGKR